MYFWWWKNWSIKTIGRKHELNRAIKENTNENELKMMSVIIHKYFGYPLYEITVK